jgi:ribulose 1,5-bisphosphate carboxylase large subunit-like protein
LQQAWEAAVEGIPAAEFATGHPELRAALDKFSS